jgi:pilus assembly protein CpaF
MRPDRIVVGEVRGGEALDMLQAMNSGHEGSMSTAHANSGTDLLARLEAMVLMSGIPLPIAAVRRQIAAGLDLIVHVARRPGGARCVTEILEVRAAGEALEAVAVFCEATGIVAPPRVLSSPAERWSG